MVEKPRDPEPPAAGKEQQKASPAQVNTDKESAQSHSLCGASQLSSSCILFLLQDMEAALRQVREESSGQRRERKHRDKVRSG